MFCSHSSDTETLPCWLHHLTLGEADGSPQTPLPLARIIHLKHLHADISVQTSPSKHLGEDMSVQRSPCRHLRAGTPMQTSPCRHADMSAQASPCRCKLERHTLIQSLCHCAVRLCMHAELVHFSLMTCMTSSTAMAVTKT